MTYQVKLEVFEGPFDLLLSVIQKQRLDVCDIPIAKIAEEYLCHIDAISDLDLEAASEFLLVAATLLDMKAAALLPGEEEDPDDEEELASSSEARAMLVERLLTYKKFKNAAAEFGVRLSAQSKFYPRVAELEERFTSLLPDFLTDVTPRELGAALMYLITREPVAIIEAEHISPAPISLEGPIKHILRRLRQTRSASFAELAAMSRTRLEVIITFLSVLELYKRGEVEIAQTEAFGHIEITLTQVRRIS